MLKWCGLVRHNSAITEWKCGFQRLRMTIRMYWYVLFAGAGQYNILLTLSSREEVAFSIFFQTPCAMVFCRLDLAFYSQLKEPRIVCFSLAAG